MSFSVWSTSVEFIVWYRNSHNLLHRRGPRFFARRAVCTILTTPRYYQGDLNSILFTEMVGLINQSIPFIPHPLASSFHSIAQLWRHDKESLAYGCRRSMSNAPFEH